MHETDESWEKMIDIVKKELADEVHTKHVDSESGLGISYTRPSFRKFTTISACCVRNLKTSQERLRKARDTRPADRIVQQEFF